MRVLAVDPGGTTGLAYAEDGGEMFMTKVLPLDEAMRFVHVELIEGIDLLVFESFHITAQTVRKSREGQRAIEFIGVGRYLAESYGIEFITQSPADAKTFTTDEKLRALDWWTTSDHTRDATRHLVLAMVKRGLIAPEKLLSC